MTSCFRSHWPGGQQLSESEVQALISSQQESGQLVTGLRRWKKRQSCRPTSSLAEDETWTCPNGCSKVYRLTSSRSIHQHVLHCVVRRASSESDVDEPTPTAYEPLSRHHPATIHTVEHTVEPHSGTAPFPSSSPVLTTTATPHVVSQHLDETATTAHTPFSPGEIPSQYDGTADDESLMGESDASNHAMLIRDGEDTHDIVFSPSSLTAQIPSFASDWEDTPLRSLLRHHSVEVQQTNARHMTEIIALQESAVGVYTEIAYPQTAYPQTYSVPLLQAY